MRTERGPRILAVACLLMTLACGCGMPAPPQHREAREPRREAGEGPGGRRQPLAMNPEQELETGKRAYEEVMQEYREKRLVVPRSDPHVARIRAVVDRLTKAAAIEPLQREINLRLRGFRFEWEVNVVKDNQINAFCLPAGKIVVFTGILRITGDDDDYLATVLSHEMAHALAHHASERVAMAKTGANVLRTLKYGRMQEEEADHIGVFIMTFAGYDPRKAVAFWQRMAQVQAQGGGGRTPEFLSDHPSDARRIRDIQGWAPQAMRALEAYRQRHISSPGGGGRRDERVPR